MAVDKKTRIELIRKGNELFNQGKILEAGRVFLTADYQDGLKRVGDHLFYEEGKPLQALPYYKQAKYQERIDEIELRMVLAFKHMMGKTSDDNETQNEQQETSPEESSPNTSSDNKKEPHP
jgi:hypothetical protein